MTFDYRRTKKKEIVESESLSKSEEDVNMKDLWQGSSDSDLNDYVAEKLCIFCEKYG